jgi:Uncharacterized conserved protein
MKLYSERAGKIYHVQSNYDCFVPASLFDITIKHDEELASLLSEASLFLGKLDGIASALPDRDLFLSMYVQKEAVVSSQIEGTQASLSDVLQSGSRVSEKRKDTEEIVNYVRALNVGVSLLDALPISFRYIKELHKELLKGVRGENKNPGEFRRSQNWVGPKGCILSTATYVPPSIDKMIDCLNDLENYMNSSLEVSPLIKIALIHYQLETIHPFLDGNGRLGRLLIPLWLKENKVLNYPLLYLSLFFKENRQEYYSLLMDVRFKGRYEEWIKFFLRGVTLMSQQAITTINEITKVKEECEQRIRNGSSREQTNQLRLLSMVLKHPYFGSSDITNGLQVSKPTASKLISDFVKMGIVSATDKEKRSYVTYRFDRYVGILEKGTEL